MKKIFLMLVMGLGTLGAFARDENVDPRVLKAFEKEFAVTTEVNWTVGPDYYLAGFMFNARYIRAYYSSEGELLGLARFITSEYLPVNLQISLKKSYSAFWVSDLFEVTRNGSISYIVTLENATRRIILKASAGGDWSSYKKMEKSEN